MKGYEDITEVEHLSAMVQIMPSLHLCHLTFLRLDFSVPNSNKQSVH